MQWQEIPVMSCFWPENRDWTLQETIEKFGLRDSYDELISEFNSLKALDKSVVPIVGVMGLVNAGKSSFVRGFLSEKNAGRVLCGQDGQSGTQRFVFWLPCSWEYNDVKDLIASRFGSSCEFLAKDPEEAHLQYNATQKSGHNLEIPLIGFDPRLDEFGFALLDCPDFERTHPGISGQDTARVRRAFLYKASKIMSAIVIIAYHNQVAGENLNNFLQADTGLWEKEKFLLINNIRPCLEVHELLKDQAVKMAMHSLGVKDVYAAYDFFMDNAESKIPDVAKLNTIIQEVPVFFKISSDPEQNLARQITQDRLIHKQLEKLDPLNLWQRQKIEATKRVRKCIKRLRQEIENKKNEHGQRLKKIRQQLLEFIRQEYTRENRLNCPLTPMLAQKLAQSIYDAAPALLKPALRFHLARKGLGKILKKQVKGLREKWSCIVHPERYAMSKAEQIGKSLPVMNKNSVINPELLTEKSRNMRFIPEDVDEELLKKAWAEVLNALTGLESELPADELHRISQDVWKDVPKQKKILYSLSGPGSLIAALAAVCLIPFDFGSTAIIFYASTPEILAALGFGLAGNSLAGEKLNNLLQNHLAVPAYARILRAALDVFGLPREIEGKDKLKEQFDNLGRVVIDLDKNKKTIDCQPVLLLAQHTYLTTELPKGWESLENELVNHKGDESCRTV